MFRKLPAHEYIIDQRPEQPEFGNQQPDFRTCIGQAAQVMDALGFVILRQTFSQALLRDMSLRGHNSSSASFDALMQSWSRPFSELAHDLERWRRRPADVDYVGSQIVSGKACHSSKDEKIVAVPNYDEPQTHIISVVDGIRRVKIGRKHMRTIVTDMESNDTLMVGRPLHGSPTVMDVIVKDITPGDESCGGQSLMFMYSYVANEQPPVRNAPA